MYGMYCDILSKDGASHKNARVIILPNGRTVKENGGETVVVMVVKW
jgi:hypothetical protein